MKSEKGLISLYVLFGMLFLLVFILSIYIGIRNKMQLEEYKNLELEELYSKNIDISRDIEFAENNELIPIYNINQLDVVGTGSYLRINNKIYKCGIGMFYILKDDIIVDIDEDLKYRKVGFNDFKFYLPTYYIDKLDYQIYYYKDNCYWKCLAYQKFSKENNGLVKNKTYLQNQFSIIGEKVLAGNKEYMIVWNDAENNLTNFDIKAQSSNDIISLNQIDVFKNNIQNIDKNSGEYYLFVNIGNSI